MKHRLSLVVWISIVAACVGCASRNPYVTGGIIDMQQSRFDSAERQFKKAIEIEPANSDAHMWLGKCYASLSRYLDAAVQFDTAVSMNQAHKTEFENEPFYFWAVYYNASLDYIRQESWDGAEKSLLRAAEIVPDSAGPYTQLSYVYTRQENYAKAEEVLKKGIEKAPNDPSLEIALARLKIRDKDYVTARGLLEKVLSRFPNNADANYYLGLVYTKPASSGDTVTQEDLQKAEEAYTRAAVADTMNRDVFFNLGSTRMKMHPPKYAQAVEAFKRSAQIDPKDEEAWLYLGICYSQMGSYDLSIETYTKIITELNPMNAEAYENRAYAKQKKGLKNEAYEDFKYAEKLRQGTK